MKRLITVAAVLLLFAITGFAQKSMQVKGTSVYYAPDYMSNIEGKAEAVKQAKVKILADYFGTTVISTSTVITGENTNASTLGECEVNGEWIKTIGDPIVRHLGYKDNTTIWEVTISGEIRELPKSNIDLSVKLLADENNQNSEKYTFSPKEQFFLKFKAPVKGYLTLYLADPEGRSVVRLLPYKKDEIGSFEVSPREEYMFFGENSGQKMLFESDRELEIDRFYVIFSTENFVKANDYADFSNSADAPVLSWDDFQRWISHCRQHDKGMCVKTFEVTIKKR